LTTLYFIYFCVIEWSTFWNWNWGEQAWKDSGN